MNHSNYSTIFQEFTQKLGRMASGTFSDTGINIEAGTIANLFATYALMCWDIKRSERFLLPDGGEILPIAGFNGLSDVSLKPPYPVVVLEFPVSKLPDAELGKSSKRLVLIVDNPDEGEVCVTPIYLADDLGEWHATVNMYLKYDDWVHDDQFKMKSSRAMPQGFYPSGVFDVDLYVSESLAELRAYASMMVALSCKNVSTKKVEPSSLINKMRARKGKLAFQGYHILTIPGGDSSGGSTNSGRSVRTHLRRGHVRRLPKSNTWVNATVVHGKKPGFVKKDYKVAA